MRYRLDDVLVASERHAPVAVQQWRLRVSKGGRMPTATINKIRRYSDRFCRCLYRVLAMTLPLTVDYRLLQTG